MLSTLEIGGYQWCHRPDTNDLGIIEQVFTNNGCHLPDDMNGKVFIDIGAHIGAASMLAASRGAQALAYEPSFDSFRVLKANVEQNNLDISPYQLGVGLPGTKKLFLSDYNTGQNSIYLLYPELNENHYEFIVCVNLATALGFRHHCDFLKLDCEGSEEEIIPQIVNGLHSRIRTIYVEFHTNARDDLISSLKNTYHHKFLGYGHMFSK